MANNAHHIEPAGGRRLFAFTCLAVGATIAVTVLFWCSKKAGFFLDEIYSYGLSNSYYAPFLRILFDGEIPNKVLSSQDLFNYVAVGPTDAFAYDSVIYNQVNDVHPPLFYLLLHTVCSLFPGVFTKWTGLALNFVLYGATMLLLYRLGKAMRLGRNASLLAVVLYGLSGIGISTMIMVRMYLLLTLFTVAFALVVAKLLHGNEKWGMWVLFCLMLLGGMLTQYFFVFYAFFLCLGVGVFWLVQREWKSCGLLIACSAIAAVAFLVVWPAGIEHFTGSNTDVSGQDIAGSLLHPSLWVSSFRAFIAADGTGYGLLAEFCVPVVLGVVGIALAVVAKLRGAGPVNTDSGDDGRDWRKTATMLAPAFVALAVIAFIAPYKNLRYAYELMPLFALCAAVLLSGGARRLVSLSQRGSSLAIGVIAVACVASIAVFQPSWLYRDDARIDAVISQNASAPCVYLTENVSPCVTSDLVQLIQFEDVLTMDEFDSGLLRDYLASHGDSDSLVLYIATYHADYDKDRVMREVAECFPFDSCTEVGTKGYSTSFVLGKGETGSSESHG